MEQRLIRRHQDPQAKGVRNVNAEHQANLSSLERMAVFISRRVGTPGFFILIALWTIFWVLWNSYGPAEYRMDRAREFAVWIFISNVIQICLMPLLMSAQNLQTRHDELRAENDFAVTMQSEKEIEQLLNHLQVLEANVGIIMDHLGISEQAKRTHDREPDLTEEQFATRARELSDATLQRLSQTHQDAIARAGSEVTEN